MSQHWPATVGDDNIIHTSNENFNYDQIYVCACTPLFLQAAVVSLRLSVPGVSAVLDTIPPTRPFHPNNIIYHYYSHFMDLTI